jgi:hypothetical protein
MKYCFPVIYFVLVSIIFLNIACENPSQTTYLSSHIKGYVLDTVTLAGLDSVTLTISELNLSTTSFSSGYYQFLNIQMPRDPFNTLITASRNGYQTVNRGISLRSNDTTHFNVMIYR